MRNLFDLDNKVAIVTGASSGLGAQFAKALAEYGAKVVLTARRVDKLESLKLEIQANGGEALVIPCDVTKEEDIKNVVDQVIRTYGQIDILVNNAGVAAMSPLESMSVEDWDKVMDTNLKGVFLFTKHTGSHMIKSRYGKIINIASIYGIVGDDMFPVSAYHASKGAVVNFTRAAAGEWAKYGITVNAIAPGFFPSEMTAGMEENKPINDYIIMRSAMDRWGRDGELNGALLYLASNSSSFTTGQILCVDGGWTAV